jgi:hypothetical protein
MISESKLARISTVALLCIGLGACGNYSNDDVDFQLALPDQGDMEAKLQVSVSRADSAEYYKLTRNAVLNFNAMVVNLTALVDAVRGYVPTSRNGNERTWGPFPDDKHPGWEIRIVMRRSTASQTLLHMDYWVQLRQVGQGDSGWVSLLTGQYTSQGSARTGYGDIHFNVQTSRAAGYPADSDPGLVELDHLDVCYNNSGDPTACANTNGAAVLVDMQITNLPNAKTQAAHYVYELAQDSSGLMQFDWQGTTDSGLAITATMHARWMATGAGRADLVADVTPNLPKQTTLGIDCWGPDTVETYSYRVRDDATLEKRDRGDASLCVFN